MAKNPSAAGKNEVNESASTIIYAIFRLEFSFLTTEHSRFGNDPFLRKMLSCDVFSELNILNPWRSSWKKMNLKWLSAWLRLKEIFWCRLRAKRLSRSKTIDLTVHAALTAATRSQHSGWKWVGYAVLHVKRSWRSEASSIFEDQSAKDLNSLSPQLRHRPYATQIFMKAQK